MVSNVKSLFILAGMFTATMGFAQQVPRLEISGGYSYLHIDSQGVTGSKLDSACNILSPGLCPPGTFKVHQGFNGWSAAAQVNLNRWLGVKADFTGHYGKPLTTSAAAQTFLTGLGVTGFPPKVSSYTFLFGPVVSKQIGRYKPFGHALFGGNRLSSETIGTGSIPIFIPGFPASIQLTDTAFAMAFGGGLDWKLTRHISLRVGQADYLLTKHDFSAGLSSVAKHQNNLRASAGIVFVFGRDEETQVVERPRERPQSGQPRRGQALLPVRGLGVEVSSSRSGLGAEVVQVVRGSVAELAGINIGDIINSVDGKSIRSPMELAAELSDRPAGSQAKVGFLVRGYWQTETVILLGRQQ